jgi:hypothetical protein
MANCQLVLMPHLTLDAEVESSTLKRLPHQSVFTPKDSTAAKEAPKFVGVDEFWAVVVSNRRQASNNTRM